MLVNLAVVEKKRLCMELNAESSKLVLLIFYISTYYEVGITPFFNIIFAYSAPSPVAITA